MAHRQSSDEGRGCAQLQVSQTPDAGSCKWHVGHTGRDLVGRAPARLAATALVDTACGICPRTSRRTTTSSTGSSRRTSSRPASQIECSRRARAVARSDRRARWCLRTPNPRVILGAPAAGWGRRAVQFELWRRALPAVLHTAESMPATECRPRPSAAPRECRRRGRGGPRRPDAALGQCAPCDHLTGAHDASYDRRPAE